MTNGENTILQGTIFEPLLKFTLPLMLAILIQALYGAVDLMIVGKFGSTRAWRRSPTAARSCRPFRTL